MDEGLAGRLAGGKWRQAGCLSEWQCVRPGGNQARSRARLLACCSAAATRRSAVAESPPLPKPSPISTLLRPSPPPTSPHHRKQGMPALPYPRSRLRALLKTWASEPAPAPADPNNTAPTPSPPPRPHALGPTVDAVAFVAWSMFMRRLGDRVVADHAGGTAGGAHATAGAGAKAGKGRGVGGKRKGRKVKVGRAEVRRAKRVSSQGM